MVAPVSSALMVSAAVIVIGFIANYMFKRTRIPDMLILIFLGALFGPILGTFDPIAIQNFAPYIAALALVYILCSPRALLLAVLGFVFSVVITAVFMVSIFNMPLLYGVLFGSIFGGSSSIIVISLVSKIKISENASITLILESIITDIFCIVASLAIIEILVTGQSEYSSIITGIGGRFLIGSLIGLFAGAIWVLIMRRVNGLPFSYILTLGAVLFTYAFSESLGGSGALSSLLFGLVLGNERQFLRFFNLNGNGQVAVTEGLKRFESEIAFLVKTFFFVFLGMTATISNLNFLFVGLVLSILLLAVRYGAVWLATLKSELRAESRLMTSVYIQGLATAVLATLPAQYGLEYADLFVNVAIVVIVTTAVIATISTVMISRDVQPENYLRSFISLIGKIKNKNNK